MKLSGLSSIGWTGRIRLLFGAVLMLALLATVDLRLLWASLLASDGTLLLASLVAAGAAAVVLEALRFQRVFAEAGVRYVAALRITLASLFVGSFTPGAVGAEAFKLYAVSRGQNGVVRPLVRLVLLRVLGLVAMLTAAAGAGLWNLEGLRQIGERIVWRWPAVSVPLVRAAGATLAILAIAAVAIGWRRIAPRARGTLQQAVEALAAFRLRLVGEVFGLSLGVALLRGVSLFFLLRGLGERCRFGDLLMAAALSVLAGALPISPAGLGVQEGVLAGCLMLLGVSPPAAATAALLNRSFLWLFAAAGAWATTATARPHPRAPA
jgi:uncharacterized membrane protein YbhN (UPF0104 family)